MKSCELTSERLHQLFVYDKITGFFRRTDSESSDHITGTKNCAGYIVMSIDGVTHYAHRLAFLYVTGRWPEHHVDHKDRNGCNNQWKNLRECDSRQNAGNSGISRHNSTGFRGVSYDKSRSRWEAYITKSGRKKSLGRFDKSTDAAKAYNSAALEHFGQFAFLNDLGVAA